MFQTGDSWGAVQIYKRQIAFYNPPRHPVSSFRFTIHVQAFWNE